MYAFELTEPSFVATMRTRRRSRSPNRRDIDYWL